MRAVTCHRLVNGVVDDFIHTVMQTALIGRTDVHAWSLADWLQSFKYLDIGRIVCGLLLGGHSPRQCTDANAKEQDSVAIRSQHLYNPRTMTDTSSMQSSSFADADAVLVTKEGLKKLREELDHLKTVRRSEVAQRLKEAISYGDLSENAEYEEAKNEQAFVEGRILELEKQVKNARIITEHDTKAAKGKVIEIGSVVTVRNKTDGDDPETYTIVGSMEADPIEHKISNESPIGKALLGREKGDIVDVTAPAGKFKYEVIKVA